jgi:hypothetical protein
MGCTTEDVYPDAGFGSYYSSDNGATWHGSDHIVWSSTSEGLTGKIFDPSVAFDRHGIAYAAFITPNFQLSIITSTDKGASWHGLKTLNGSLGDADKPYIAIDNAPTSSGNTIHVFWRGVTSTGVRTMYCATSTDGGANFTNAPVSDAGQQTQGASPVVDDRGVIWCAYGVGDYSVGQFTEHSIHLRYSMDGQTFHRANSTGVVYDQVNQNGIYDAAVGDFLLKGSYTDNSATRVNSFPSLAVDHNGSQRSIYIAWANTAVHPYNPTVKNPDILICASHDDGANWGQPFHVNDDGASAIGTYVDHWHPFVAVGGDHVVNVLFLDSRCDPANNKLTRAYVARRLDDNHYYNYAVSDAQWEPRAARDNFFNAKNMGDYMGMACRDNMVFPVWIDRRLRSGKDPKVDIYTSPLVFPTIDQKYSSGVTTGDGSAPDNVQLGVYDPTVGHFESKSVPLHLATTPGNDEVLRGVQSMAQSSTMQWQEKYANWNSLADVTNPKMLTQDEQAHVYLSNLEQPSMAFEIVNEIEGTVLPSTAGTIGFKDPWLVKSNNLLYQDAAHDHSPMNLGPNCRVEYTQSPLLPNSGASDAQLGITYNGVFSYKYPPSSPSQVGSYYAVSATPVLDANGARTAPGNLPNVGEFAFIGFSTDNSKIQVIPATPAGDTAVVFKDPTGGTLKLQYKSHFATLNDAGAAPTFRSPGLPTNSQRAIVYYGGQNAAGQPFAGTDFFAMVYLDNGRLYFTFSTDLGSSWNIETPMDATSDAISHQGTVGSASLCARADGHVGIVFEDLSNHHLVFRDGAPVVNGGDLRGFSWTPADKSDPRYSQLLASDGQPIKGTHPVIAPMKTAGGSRYTDAYWVVWQSDWDPDGYGVLAAIISKNSQQAYEAMVPQAPQLGTRFFRVPQSMIYSPWSTTVWGKNPTCAPEEFSSAYVADAAATTEGDWLHLSWSMAFPMFEKQPAGLAKIYYSCLYPTTLQGDIGSTPAETASDWAQAASIVFPGTLNCDLSSRWNDRPSIATDVFTSTNPDNTVTTKEEPVIAYELDNLTTYSQIQPYSLPTGSHSMITLGIAPLTFRTTKWKGVAVARRCVPNPMADHGANNKYWRNKPGDFRKYAQLFLASQDEGWTVDHPSMTAFPADDKSNLSVPYQADLQAAVSFHISGKGFCWGGGAIPVGNFTGIAYSYPFTFMPVPGASLSPYSLSTTTPCWTFNSTKFGVEVEPHLSLSRYSITPWKLGAGPLNPATMNKTTHILYKESQTLTTTSSFYRFVTSASNTLNPAFGKIGHPEDMETSSNDYLGLTVSVDTLGQATVLLGEVATESSTDTAKIPMMFAYATVDTGANVPLERRVRSQSFALSPGMILNAACHLLSDSMSMVSLISGTETVHYVVEAVDSMTGTPVLPMYDFMFGNGMAPNLPMEFPDFLYVGPPVAHAYVRVRCTVQNRLDSTVGKGIVAVHSLGSPIDSGFAKEERHSAGRLGMVKGEINPINLAVFPNPVNGSSTPLVSFSIPAEDADALAEVKVYDIEANDIATLVHDIRPSGRFNVTLDNTRLPAGRYIVAVHLSSHQQSKLIVVKK